MSFARQNNTSQSSEESPSPQSSHEGRLPKVADSQPDSGVRPGASFEAILTHLEAPLQTSLAALTLPAPSPTSSTVYTLPPISLPSPRRGSYTSNLGGISYEPGAHDLTTQKLQRENASLVSAYSSAQVRIADLEQAAQASSLDIGKLVKDRQKLKAKIDVLEAEVDELQTGIELSQQHTVAKDAQYSHIVELSTKLQTQAASDTHQRRAEQEQWAYETQEMQNIIATFRSEIQNLRTGEATILISKVVNKDGIADTKGQRLDGASSTTLYAGLRTEPTTSHLAKSGMEDALIGVRKEYAQLTDCIEKLGIIGENIQTHLQVVSGHDSIPLLEGEAKRFPSNRKDS